MTDTKLQQQISELESRLAFQEQTLQELNEVITRQDEQMMKMQVQLQYLAKKLKEVSPSQLASEQEETPPPHY